MAKADPKLTNVAGVSQKDGSKDSAQSVRAVPKFKVKRIVTLPLLKLVNNEAIFIRPIAPMFLGKELKQKKDDDKKKGPATLMNVIELVNNREMQVICNTVLQSILKEEYPDDKYVGLFFQITKLPAREGRDYNGFEVIEIEVETDEQKS